MSKVPISGNVTNLEEVYARFASPSATSERAGAGAGSASGLDMFHQSARGGRALETRGGKRQLEAMGGCLLRAIMNLLATEFAGWSEGIATHLGQADSYRLVEGKPYIAALHIREHIANAVLK